MAPDHAQGAREAVSASQAALDVITRLSAAHGPLMFVQSGGCCDGGSPVCLKQGELPLGPHDVHLGNVAGSPFYIDSEQFERWGRPHLTLEVSRGATDSFSLEGLEGVHFVTRTEP
jgi:uncharacterized protein